MIAPVEAHERALASTVTIVANIDAGHGVLGRRRHSVCVTAYVVDNVCGDTDGLSEHG